MPSPFPGRDPYLEGDLWTSVHFDLASQLRRMLAPLLRPRYFPFAVRRSIEDFTASGRRTAAPQITTEIRDVACRRLVTVVELLVPPNKIGSGRDEYLHRRRQVLECGANLVEIDLHRAGERIYTSAPLPPDTYCVMVTRHNPLRASVCPIPLSAPLPQIAVPLPDGDLSLDLRQALSEIRRLCGYDLIIDYTCPPPGPLTPEASAWIDARLREAGKRG